MPESGLATTSIGHQLAESLDYNEFVKEFGDSKARRVFLTRVYDPVPIIQSQ